jgi:hypothetical protein
LKPVADQSLPAPFVKGFTGIAAIATAVVFSPQRQKKRSTHAAVGCEIA